MGGGRIAHFKLKTRMVHVRLTEDVHKKLRIRAAETDMTLQDWVAIAIKNELDRQDREKGKGDNTPEMPLSRSAIALSRVRVTEEMAHIVPPIHHN